MSSPKLPEALEKLIDVVLAHKPKIAKAKIVKKQRSKNKSAKKMENKRS
jgi:hypothetical protein